MADDQMDFDTALSQAQQKGYAEADPTDDIDGIDAANKLAILTALAFGTAPDISSIFVEGIRNITQKDLRDAAARGGRIKLLGIATRTPSGITQRVQPVFVPMNEMLASVSGADNGVEIVGDFVGDVFLQGKGAGGAATASSVVADLIDIARGNRNYAFGVPAEKIGAAAREENPMA
jgi:homoserine dehydrogenase